MGDADESPTPTLDSTAREERRPAILLEKACKESCVLRSGQACGVYIADSTHIDLVPTLTVSHYGRRTGNGRNGRHSNSLEVVARHALRVACR